MTLAPCDTSTLLPLPERRLCAEQVRLLYDGIPAALLASVLTAFLLVAVLGSITGLNQLLGWLIPMGMVMVWRGGMYLRYRRASPVPEDQAPCHLRRFRLMITTTGMAWGLAGLVLFPPEQVAYQALLAFTLAGVSSAGAISLSVDRFSSLGLVLPALAPLILSFIIEGSDISHTMGLLLVLSLGFVLASVSRIQHHLQENIQLRIDASMHEETLVTARDEAERANHAKSEFLSNMSHELRTPMNAIMGFGQLLEYDDRLEADQRESVREITKAGNHLLELINEILDLARVESGQIKMSIEPVEVFPVMEECLILMTRLADQRGIQIKMTVDQDTVVRADRTRLKQVFLNLLSNAIKYNSEGGRITIEERPVAEGRVRILVTDTGPGIPAKKMGNLFQPFNRLGAEKAEVEGTGIGLTLTKSIIEQMDGRVDAESKVGLGSTFWIELPLESLSEPEQVHAHQPPAVTHSLDNKGEAEKHLVLHIEDNPANLRLVEQILKRCKNIELLSAHRPELGIDMAQYHKPKLILLDINMPGMDGYQVLQWFKGSADLHSIPVIAISANAMAEDIERGKAAGFSDYLTKPLDMDGFLKTMERYLPC